MDATLNVTLFETPEGDMSYKCFGFDEAGEPVDVTEQYEIGHAETGGKKGFIVFKRDQEEE